MFIWNGKSPWYTPHRTAAEEGWDYKNNYTLNFRLLPYYWTLFLLSRTICSCPFVAPAKSVDQTCLRSLIIKLTLFTAINAIP